MNKKLLTKILLLIVLAAINVYVIKSVHLGEGSLNLQLNILLEMDHTDNVQLYYSDSDEFSEDQSGIVQYNKLGDTQRMSISIVNESPVLRLDLGQNKGHIRIDHIEYSSWGKHQEISLQALSDSKMIHDISNITLENDSLLLEATGEDPYIVFRADSSALCDSVRTMLKKISLIFAVVLCILIDLIALFVFRHFDSICDSIYILLVNRRLIANLSVNDFKVRYVGSYLGIFWSFINPLVTIILYWLVFQFAFQSGDVDGHPFVLWLMAGLVPWFFISEAITNGTAALMEYSYLVKKVLFEISVLPPVKVISACIVHGVFMFVVLGIYVCLGYYPSLYWIQLIYYFICMLVFVAAIVYITSSVVLFVRDLSQFINVFMQVFMWATPIMWQVQIVPAKFQWIFRLNPAYYIITGYRDSLLYHIGVWERLGYSLYFWCVVGLLWIGGTVIFKRLRPHFADVI